MANDLQMGNPRIRRRTHNDQITRWHRHEDVHGIVHSGSQLLYKPKEHDPGEPNRQWGWTTWR